MNVWIRFTLSWQPATISFRDWCEAIGEPLEGQDGEADERKATVGNQKKRPSLSRKHPRKRKMSYWKGVYRNADKASREITEVFENTVRHEQYMDSLREAP